MEDDELPVQLRMNDVGYVGRVEVEDVSRHAHDWFPSLTDRTYGWRYVDGKDTGCVDVSSSCE